MHLLKRKETRLHRDQIPLNHLCKIIHTNHHTDEKNQKKTHHNIGVHVPELAANGPELVQ